MASANRETDTRQANQGYDEATRDGEPYDRRVYGKVIEISEEDSVDGDLNGAPDLAGVPDSEEWDGVDALDALHGTAAAQHGQATELPPDAERRETLEKRRVEILERIEESRPGLAVRDEGRVGSALPPPRDPAEVPSEPETVAALEAELARIDRALARLEQGEYGSCLSCGRSINPDALDDEPDRELCALCESDRGRPTQ
jgi:DnaK suppressor protein